MVFLKECFKANRIDPSALIYQLASLWGIDTESSRFLQLAAYLDCGLNEQAESMVNMMQDKARLMDEILHAVRKRIGTTIACMDHILEYSGVLVSMEAASSAWCRAAVGKPNEADIIAVAKGIKAAVDFDLVGTRHLILRVQALLLSALSESRDRLWKERKEKCDVLLALCTTLVPAQNRLLLK